MWITANIRENEGRGDAALRLSGPIAHDTHGATEISTRRCWQGKQKQRQNQNSNQKAISSDRKESREERGRRRDAREREEGASTKNNQETVSIIPQVTEGMDCPTRNVSSSGTQTATTINERLPNQKRPIPERLANIITNATKCMPTLIGSGIFVDHSRIGILSYYMQHRGAGQHSQVKRAGKELSW